MLPNTSTRLTRKDFPPTLTERQVQALSLAVVKKSEWTPEELRTHAKVPRAEVMVFLSLLSDKELAKIRWNVYHKCSSDPVRQQASSKNPHSCPKCQAKGTNFRFDLVFSL